METDNEDAKYKPGESVTCRIKSPEPGGYLVEILPALTEGFLPSHEPIELGRLVPATFVCMSNGRALMAYAFMIGTTERVQLSTASDSENAFAVWADSYPRTVRLRRAIDIFMPPFAAMPKAQTVKGKEAIGFLTTLERERFTGCIKVDAQSQLSRSACLFYQGRAVGAIYTKKPLTEPYPVEAAIELMIGDLQITETQVETYELPDIIVLPMSAMFLGVLVHRPEENTKSNLEIARELLAQFQSRHETGCLNLQLPSQPSLGGLCFIHDGEYKGAYSIEERRYRSDEEFLDELFDKYLKAKLEAFVLPDVMTSDSVRFGYSLVSGQFNLTS